MDRMPRKPKKAVEDGKTIQYTTLKVRLYPDAAQAELFEKTFGSCRYIWNRMLADEERFYVETDKHFIPTPAKYKKEAPFLAEVDNQALIQEHNKLSQAFRQFFKDPGHFGHPKYKRKKADKDTYTACNHEFESGPTIYVTKDGLRLTKAGIVKAKFSRRPRSGWKLKRVTVEKTQTGKYYACILYEYTVKEPERVTPTLETTLGLKYSMAHFYVADNGEAADAPEWEKRSREKLAKLQKRLSRMERGSKNYLEAVQKYRELNEHIANQRRDYIHKRSSRIANDWEAVCVRSDLLDEVARALPYGNVKDTGFGRFREYLRYKLERQGKSLIMVDRYAPTTRTCSVCGTVRDSGTGSKARWVCPKCGTVHDREVNAARNIKEWGLAQSYGIGGRAIA